jgi:type I restriction enzyme M protein
MTEDEFKQTMLGLNDDFTKLSAEAKKLEKEIAENLKELFK